VAEGAVEVESQRRKLAQEGLKPRVDLRMGHTSRGLAGREVPSAGIGIPGFDLSPPPFLIGSYGRGFNQLWHNNYPSYEASLEVELPIFQRQARGELGTASAALRRATLQRKQAEIQVSLEVRQAMAALRAARERIEEADGAVESSRLRLESEQRLYREGLSDNLSLNVRQNELADSQRAAVDARRAWHLAAAELRRATAQSFEDFGIRLQ
jgi:outer membrane protein TolC